MSVDFTAGDLSVAIASPLTVTSCTVIGWAQMTTNSAGDWVVVSLDNGGAIFFQLSRQNTSGVQEWAIWSDVQNGGATGTNLFTQASALNLWVFFAVVGAPTTSTVYWSVNNAAISSQTLSSSAGPATKLWIGNDGFNSGFFPGVITGVKVFSSSFSAAQVADEFYKGPPVSYANQWAFYANLNAAEAPTDWSGNGRNLTTASTLANSSLAPPITWARNQNVLSL